MQGHGSKGRSRTCPHDFILNKSVFFNIITYLLLNSDYGIECVYSPLGLVTFVAVEGTFACFTD